MVAAFAGYAYSPDESERREAIQDRYQEIEHLNAAIAWHWAPTDGRTNFTARIIGEAALDLSESDILMLADGGNLCFGGLCQQESPGVFSGYYSID